MGGPSPPAVLGRRTCEDHDHTDDRSDTPTSARGGTPLSLTNTWDGSDPQQGPSFGIGNL